MRWLLASALVVMCCAGAGQAWAHPLAPAALRLVEGPGHQVTATWREPAVRPTGQRLVPRLPEGCRESAAAKVDAGETWVETTRTWDCAPAGLLGAQIGIEGLRDAPTNVVLHVTLADGSARQQLLHAGLPTYRVPPRPGPAAVALQYAVLGVEHLATGLDHVLFILGLLLLVGWRRRLVAAVTAFTLGHSVTLALATLGVVTLPSALVEVAIAASLVVLALEVLEPGEGWFARRPWLVCGAFGLLHGLGFAGALSETGLPDDAVPLALAAFNIGLELGQLGLLAVAVVVWRAAARLVPALSAWSPGPAGWVIGVMGACYVIERLWPAG